MLQLKGVTKQYLYGARVLGAVDLTLGDGEILALLGGELSGKTTFLKVIAGVTDCEGSIELNGKSVEDKNDDVMMVFDDLAIFKYRSGYYNLAYSLKLRKLDKLEIDKLVRAAAEKMDIVSCLSVRAGKLSLLDKKRLAFARIYLRPAKLILVDSLTNGLNLQEARTLWSECAPLLLEKAREGVSVVYSTCERSEAISIADRIAVLHYGEIKQVDTVQQIWHNPQNIWAAQALDCDYTFEKVTLINENGKLSLLFSNDENGNSVTLDAQVFESRVAQNYIGKQVLVGWWSDGYAESGERMEDVEYALREDDAYVLCTKSGKRVRSVTKKDSVCTLPKMVCAGLFDATNENSILTKN